jgi:hypothetical protein
VTWRAAAELLQLAPDQLLVEGGTWVEIEVAVPQVLGLEPQRTSPGDGLPGSAVHAALSGGTARPFLDQVAGDQRALLQRILGDLAGER